MSNDPNQQPNPSSGPKAPVQSTPPLAAPVPSDVKSISTGNNKTADALPTDVLKAKAPTPSLVTSPVTKPSPGVTTPEKPDTSTSPTAPAIAAGKRESTDERASRVADALEKFIEIKQAGDASYYSHEGICKKCGWHTLQNSEHDAQLLVRQHVQQHWKAVA